MIGLSPKRSPLVQSGERSHPAMITAGVTIIVRRFINRFTSSIAPSTNVLPAADSVAIVPPSPAACVISHPVNKNIPIIPIRGMRKDVFIFLNIWRRGNKYGNYLFEVLKSDSLCMSQRSLSILSPESGITTVARFTIAS